MKNSQKSRNKKWKIIIKKKNKNKIKVIYLEKSEINDPEEAWAEVFSRWIGNHREIRVLNCSDKGVIAKKTDSQETFELMVDYTRIG